MTQSSMGESDFLRRAEDTLGDIELAIERSGADAECSLSGLVLTIECGEDGARIVVNAQAPLRQIWLASIDGGRHFSWDGEAWRDVRDGTGFYAALSQALSRHSGTPVDLA
jgi:CyaY protein